jgi:hypothetical protein
VTRPWIPIAVALALLPAIACSGLPTAATNTSTSTTTTTTAPVSTATTPTVFEGTLDPRGSAFYSFKASQAGTVTATLASVLAIGQRGALTVPLRIGVGTPAGVGCALSQFSDVTPGLTPQFSTAVAAGISCLGVVDIGDLPGPSSFAIKFTYP